MNERTGKSFSVRDTFRRIVQRDMAIPEDPNKDWDEELLPWEKDEEEPPAPVPPSSLSAQ